MPRCKVISHEGNGLYLVELQQDWSILDRKIADLTTIIDTLTPQISTAETVYNGLKSEFDALVDIQELALADLVDANNDPSRESERKALTDAVVEATNNAQKKRPAVQTAYQKWQILLVKKQQYQNKKTDYEANPRTNAWVNAQAVDKIDGTSSVNIPTGGTYPVLAPNTIVDAYQLNREADTPLWYIPTALQHNESTIPGLLSEIVLPANINGNIISDDLIEDGAQYWNCAMLPGFQRWNSHIRRGVITAINGVIFTVRLTPILSGVDTPLIGEQDTFNFNVNYYCGTSAFIVGDAVIVRIDEWSDTAPVGYVIGFADGPARECQYSQPSQYLFTWPKFSMPLGDVEIYPEIFISDVLYIISETAPGVDDPPAYYDLVATSTSGFKRYLVFFKTSHFKQSVVVRDENYPTVPDHPGTGTRSITIGNFSATVPRRLLTVTMPDPPIYRGGTVPELGEPYQYFEKYQIQSIVDWERDPDFKSVLVTGVDPVNDILTVPNHGWSAGTRVSSSNNSGGLSTFAQYYVGNPGANTITLHTSKTSALAGTNRVNVTAGINTSIRENGPEKSREFTRKYDRRLADDFVIPVTTMGENWSFEGNGEFYTTPTNFPYIEETILARDNISFTATMNTVHGVFTRQYSIFRFPPFTGGTVNVEFWCTGDPDVYI